MLRVFIASAALLASGLATGCFTERLPPPAFRYACGSDTDCGMGDRCISGLCQTPCSQATFAIACDTRAHAACFNGTCASLCEIAEGAKCPSPQTCIDVGLGALSPESAGFGICGTTCTSDTCPEGESCLEGFCVQSCDPANPAACADGFVCTAGFCLPGTGAPMTTAPGTGDSASSDTDEGDGSSGESGSGG